MTKLIRTKQGEFGLEDCLDISGASQVPWGIYCLLELNMLCDCVMGLLVHAAHLSLLHAISSRGEESAPGEEEGRLYLLSKTPGERQRGARRQGRH